MKIDHVFVQDIYEQNPVIDRECDPRITVPVVRLSEVETILREAVVIATAYTKQRRCYYDAMADFADDPRMTDEQIGVGEPVYMRAVKFLASVAEWREREGGIKR